jgi:hypothetical protein
MRRTFVLFSLLLAAASALIMVGPAGAQLSPRTICPQVSCCGPPTAALTCCAQTSTCCPSTACCGSTACCPAGTNCCATGTCCTAPCSSDSLTITASPNPSTAGRKVVISGVLSASPSGDAQVVLWRERAGQSTFHQVTSTTTDGSGDYTFTLKPGTVMADQAWYVTSGSLRSATLDQDVRALVGLTPSARTIVAGQAVLLHGNVTPSHAGGVVLIEQRRGGSWHVIARPRLSKGSDYSLSRRFMNSGKSQLRAVLQLDARNLASTSPTVTLTVRS